MYTKFHLIYRPLLVGCLLISVLLTTTAATPFDIRLQVNVTDCASNQPIGGASVTVLTAATLKDSQSTATTSARGNATIYPLREGDIDHNVQVSATGYETATKIQFMHAWSTVNMSICLNRQVASTAAIVAPPPPGTLAATQCNAFLTEKLKDVVLPEQVNSLPAWVCGGASCTVDCSRTGGAYKVISACYRNCSARGDLASTAQSIIKAAKPAGQVTSVLRNLLDSKGLETCGKVEFVVKDLAKELSRRGMAINFLGVHSPARVLITDKEGRQAGFLNDGSIVETIPNSKAVQLGESKFVIYPGSPEVTIHFTGSGDGSLGVEMIHPKGSLVQDMGFYDIPVTGKTTADLDLSGAQPVLKVDPQGDGNVSSRPPDSYEEISSTPVAVETPTPTGTITTTPRVTTTTTITPSVTPTAGGISNMNPWLVGGGGVCLALVLIAIAGGGGFFVGMSYGRRAKKQPAGVPTPFAFPQPPAFPPQAQPRPPAPPPPAAQPPAQQYCHFCGQPFRPGAKFCPKCGRSM